MTNDPIVEDIHKIRENLIQQHGDSIQQLSQAMREQQKAAKRVAVTRSPRKPVKETDAA